MSETTVRRQAYPLPFTRLVRIGQPFNHTHAELVLDFRQWSAGFRWHRSYSGLSEFLNLWTFEFSLPLLTLTILIRHGELP